MNVQRLNGCRWIEPKGQANIPDNLVRYYKYLHNVVNAKHNALFGDFNLTGVFTTFAEENKLADEGAGTTS
jgi:hypothetical protein